MRSWTKSEIKEWVNSQTGPDYWYQTIPIRDEIVTPGTVDAKKRMELINLSDDLAGKSVLDVGCNSGLLCFECKKRNAGRVIGVDTQHNRLNQARTLAEIMGLDVEFLDLDLFNSNHLGSFDIVFCIAVLSEVTDLIGGLEILKGLTKRTLYLELPTIETLFRKSIGPLNMNMVLELNLNSILGSLGWNRNKSLANGSAKLRRIESKLKKGWSFVPNYKFLESVIGDDFEINNLGFSTRYNLFRIERIR